MTITGTITKHYNYRANPQPHQGIWPVWYRTKTGKYKRIPYDKMRSGPPGDYVVAQYDIEHEPEIKELFRSLPRHFKPDPIMYYWQFNAKPRNRILGYWQDHHFSIMQSSSALLVAVAIINLLLLIFVFSR